MSTDTQDTGLPHWPRIRITRLLDVLNQAKDWNELCRWFIDNAGSGRYKMYWEVPRGYVVRLGCRRIYGGYGANASAEPPLAPDGSILPKVKFVCLAPRISEQVAQQAYRTGTFVKPRILVDRFPGGLSASDDASLPAGLFETLPASAELYIQLLSPTAPNAWEMMDVDQTCVYLDTHVLESIRSHLESIPHLQSPQGSMNAASAEPEAPALPASCDNWTSTTTAQAPPNAIEQVAQVPKSPGDDATVMGLSASPSANSACQDAPSEGSSDPYNLKGRADAVYILYQVAEQCSRTADFRLEPSATKRHASAEALLLGVIKDDPLLQKKVFSDTRRAQAIKLIDRERDPKSGTAMANRRIWPTPAAQKLFDTEDGRRQPFVNETLELVIRVTELWIEKVPNDRRSKAGLVALDELLTEYGLGLSGERNNLFPIITWNGQRAWQAPKSEKQSTSHGQVTEARRASRRRGA